MSAISILAREMENCLSACRLLSSQIKFPPLPVCVVGRGFKADLTSLLLLWGPASCASLQDCPRHLVNTGNTKPLNTSLLCMENYHDNMQWISRRAGCLLGGYTLRYAQAVPFSVRVCSFGLRPICHTKYGASHCRDTKFL